MYAAFFGLRQAPFSIAPDPHYLFMSERHREALAHLLYGVQGGGGFVLLTGEIGAGKTTVCRAFLEQVPGNCRVAYIFNPKLTVGDLLRTICHEFQVAVQHEGPGPATIKDYLDPLNSYLLASHAQGLHNLLIVDEAQNLTPHVLEQLRLLTNLETHERKLLQIILIGQPELRQQLARPDLEQLAQRVIARYHLGALSESETRQYMQHRLAVAGLNGPLPFDPEAVASVHRLARGVPRRINLLCDRALLGAYASDRHTIDAGIVERAASEVFESEAPPEPAAPAPRSGVSPWLALGLGVVGGILVLALALLALWHKPDLLPMATGQAPAASATPPADTSPTLPKPAIEAGSPVAGETTSPVPVVLPLLERLPAQSELLPNERAGWQSLASLWNTHLSSEDPCAEAAGLGLQCFRTDRMTLHGLRQLDRPAMLKLRLPDGTASVLLVRLDGDSATLQAAEQRWRVTLPTLQDAWKGHYATLWRTPPGSRGHIASVSSGPAAQWMDDQLQALEASGRIPPAGTGFASRVQALQRSQGIEPRGAATPLTFMQVNRLAGVDEPRLSAP